MASSAGTLVLAVVGTDRTGEGGVIAAALETLGLPDGLALVERRGLVERDAHRVEPLDPGAVTAALETLTAVERRSVHKALAGALDGTTEPSRVVLRAAHLVKGAAGPDDAAARAAEQAAEAVDERGDVLGAADWYERAARLSTDAHDVAHRLTRAGERLFWGTAHERAREILTEAIGTAPTPSLRAEAAILLGQLELWERGPQRSLDALLSAANAAAEEDPDRAALLLVHAANASAVSGDARASLTHAHRSVELAEAGTGATRIPATIALGFARVIHGDTEAAEECLGSVRDLALGLLESDIPEVDHLCNVLGMIDVATERWATAETFLERVCSKARLEGATSMLGMTSAILGVLRWRTGRWDEAWQLASGPLLDGAIQPVSRAWAQAVLAHMAAPVDREEECRRLAEQALGEAEILDAPVVAGWANSALGLLELSLGHPSVAALHLDRVAALADALDQHQPGMLWWQADHIEALWRSGRRHEAGRALHRFDADIALAGGPAAAAAAARCRGLVAEDSVEAEAAFARGVELHRQVTVPFELARLMLCRAERALSGADPEAARADLDEAAAIFTALGATPWIARVDAVRERAGGGATNDQLTGLTPAELRVAEAVSRGLTNREVANELFVSTKTVDFHLQRIYRKLNVRSRTELALRVTQ